MVFIPGVAERLFPQKVNEEPILRDRERGPLGLDTNEDRVAAERLALRLAVGAARDRLYVSYPRVDLDQSRPRVPSFYGLEVIRAAEGALPGFDELARRAEAASGARIGWPAPPQPERAIDEAEYDLALLEKLFHLPEEKTVGTARYLLSANAHLARALRSRARRWTVRKWLPVDGLVDPTGRARAALDRHALAARSYSATALQTFATCPYKFLLYAVHRLAPRESPEAIEEMDPIQRGSLVHEALYELCAALRAEGLLPVTAATLPRCRALLDDVASARVAARFHDDLSPAIERVWEDGLRLRARCRLSAMAADAPPRGLGRRAHVDPVALRALVRPARALRSRPGEPDRAGGARLRHPAPRLHRPGRAERLGRAARHRLQDRQGARDRGRHRGGRRRVAPAGALRAGAGEALPRRPRRAGAPSRTAPRPAGFDENVASPRRRGARRGGAKGWPPPSAARSARASSPPRPPPGGVRPLRLPPGVRGPYEETRLGKKSPERLVALRSLRALP